MKGFFFFAQVPGGYPKVILAGRFPYENAGKLRMVQVRVSFHLCKRPIFAQFSITKPNLEHSGVSVPNWLRPIICMHFGACMGVQRGTRKYSRAPERLSSWMLLLEDAVVSRVSDSCL